MKICFLIADISGRGGTERVTSIIANGLSERQFEVDIITCRNKPESFFFLNKEIKIYSLGAEKITNRFIRKLMNMKRLWRLVCDKKYDVIIAVDVYIFYYLLAIQILKKSHCIAWEHFNCNVSNMKFSNLARLLAVRFADQVVVLGKQDLCNYMRKYKKYKKVTCIYNPVVFEKTVNKNIDKHRIIAAGRLAEQKGFDLLIDAWNIIEKKYEDSDWILDIYGTGRLETQLLHQINKYGLTRVHLKGYADDLDTEYLNSSIFVLSSRYEGFGLVLIEAQACGLPCVSFDCQVGPREIIDDKVNGYLVENGNVKHLADSLLKLMNDEKLRKEFSVNAHKDLRRFDLKNVLNGWEALLNTYQIH